MRLQEGTRKGWSYRQRKGANQLIMQLKEKSRNHVCLKINFTCIHTRIDIYIRMCTCAYVYTQVELACVYMYVCEHLRGAVHMKPSLPVPSAVCPAEMT